MGGRRYNIFISSTFKDMDVERDIIKYDVISLLNDRYRQYQVEFHAVDLRFGVNTENMTEEDGENAVLDVCLSMIDSSRPFFIGLIGERYGWIPTQERMNSVLSRLSHEKRSLLLEDNTCSVTELEILYASLCGDNGQNSNRCLFMIRNPESYNGIPENIMHTYSDGRRDRLDSLKNRVYDILKSRGKEGSYIPYTLTWNSKKEQFEGLPEFCKLVFDNMCAHIDCEITNLAKPLSWNEMAESMSYFRIKNNSEGALDLYGIETIINHLEDCSRLLISGSLGIGKSVLLSQIFTLLKSQEGIFPLCSLIGVTPEVVSLNNILFLWIRELEGNMSLDYTSLSVLNDERAYKLLYDRFYELVDLYDSKGVRIICLLDNFDNIAKEEYGISQLLWLRRDLKLIVSCDIQSLLCTSLRERVDAELCLDDMSFDINKLIVSQENSSGLMLPERVEHLMKHDKVTPMQVNLFLRIFSNLTAHDFNLIRSSSHGTEIEKINNYIINLYSCLPKGNSLFKSTVDFIAERMSATWLKRVVTYLASSRTGLRVCDLSNLIGENWDELKFIVFMNIFKDFFTLHNVTKIWKLEIPELCDLFSSEFHIKEISTLVSTYPDDDSLKQTYLAYYTLLSSDVEVAEKYLCSETIVQPSDKNGFWSSDAINMLRYDENRFLRVSALLKQLSSVSKFRVIYAIINRIPILNRREWFSEFAIQYTEFSNHIDGVSDLYALAWFLNDAALHLKYSHKSKTDYSSLIDGACMAYKKCYDMDPTYQDVKNMYTVAMMYKADILCENGNFDEALEIYKMIQ